MSPERLLPHVALSLHAHNRMGLRRTDEEWLAETMADPTTRVLVVSGNRLRPVDGGIEWTTPVDAPDGTVDRAEPVARHDEDARGGVGHLLGEPGVVGPPEPHPVVRVGGEGDVREKAFGRHAFHASRCASR